MKHNGKMQTLDRNTANADGPSTSVDRPLICRSASRLPWTPKAADNPGSVSAVLF